MGLPDPERVRRYTTGSLESPDCFDHGEVGGVPPWGCRSFPSLILALKDPERQEGLTGTLNYLLTPREWRGQLVQEEFTTAIDPVERATLPPEDSAKERPWKGLVFRE
jgi:hypothetical protein